MNKGRIWLVSVGVLLLTACPSQLFDEISRRSDTTAPVGDAWPTSGAVIAPGTAITVEFDAPMNADTLTLSGSMAPQSDKGTWNAPEFDAVEIRPLMRWAAGDQVLIIDCRDVIGNAMATLTLAFVVDDVNPLVESLTPNLSRTPIINAERADTPIELLFSKPMNADRTDASLLLDGTTDLDAGVHFETSWATDSLLAISPIGNWTEGEISLRVTGSDTIGNQMTPFELDFLVDITPPEVLSWSPGLGTVIDRTDSITISFSKRVETATFALSGQLLDVDYSVVWSAEHDQLTVTPGTGWRIGPVQDFALSVEDAAQNLLEHGAQLFDVAVVFVAPEGDDAALGTRDHPKRGLRTAIEDARNRFGEAYVAVSAGIYDVSFVADTHVVLRPGVSVYGGYGPDWLVRDPSLFVSEIREISVTGGGNVGTLDPTEMNRAVEASGSVARATVLDGFTIRGGGGDPDGWASAIYLYSGASPTIRNCTVHTATIGIQSALIAERSDGAFIDNTVYRSVTAGHNGVWTIAIMFDNTTGFDFHDNTITGIGSVGGDGMFGLQNIRVSGSTVRFSGNYIESGHSATDGVIEDYGVAFIDVGADSVFERNAIVCATGTRATVGLLIEGSSPMVRNNVIHLPGVIGENPYMIGIRVKESSKSSTASPSVLNNTVAFGPLHSTGGSLGSRLGMTTEWDVQTQARVENNIFFASESDSALDLGVHARPQNMADRLGSLKNNCFYGFSIFYRDIDADYSWTDSSLFEYGLWYLNDGRTFAEGNVSRDPVFIDISSGNFRLHGTAHQLVRTGGLALSDVTDDRDGNARTVPYSIGAYERD